MRGFRGMGYFLVCVLWVAVLSGRIVALQCLASGHAGRLLGEIGYEVSARRSILGESWGPSPVEGLRDRCGVLSDCKVAA